MSHCLHGAVSKRGMDASDRQVKQPGCHVIAGGSQRLPWTERHQTYPCRICKKQWNHTRHDSDDRPNRCPDLRESPVVDLSCICDGEDKTQQADECEAYDDWRPSGPSPLASSNRYQMSPLYGLVAANALVQFDGGRAYVDPQLVAKGFDANPIQA